MEHRPASRALGGLNTVGLPNVTHVMLGRRYHHFGHSEVPAF